MKRPKLVGIHKHNLSVLWAMAMAAVAVKWKEGRKEGSCCVKLDGGGGGLFIGHKYVFIGLAPAGGLFVCLLVIVAS